MEDHVIHYTREWNPAIENQATDRAYRIGQTKDVQVYYPIVYDNFFETAEQKIHELLEDKAQLYKNVMIPTGKLEISKEELAKILQVMQ